MQSLVLDAGASSSIRDRLIVWPHTRDGEVSGMRKCTNSRRKMQGRSSNTHGENTVMRAYDIAELDHDTIVNLDSGSHDHIQRPSHVTAETSPKLTNVARPR